MREEAGEYAPSAYNQPRCVGCRDWSVCNTTQNIVQNIASCLGSVQPKVLTACTRFGSMLDGDKKADPDDLFN